MVKKDGQFYKFAMYGFLKNLRFFEPFLILFFRDIGLSFFQIGLLFTIREAITNVTEIPTGVLADSVGRRITMVFSMVAYICSFAIFFFLNSYAWFIVAMSFFGLGESLRSGTHKSLIMSYLRMNNWENKKVAYYGLTRSYSQMGSAINSLIAAFLVFFYGDYKIVFLAALIPYIINLVNLATYPKAIDEEIREKKPQKHSFLTTFKSVDNIKIYLNSSLFDAFFKTVKEYLQPILASLALSLPFFVDMNLEKRTSVVVGICYFFIYILTSYASKNSYRFVEKSKKLSMALNVTFITGIILILMAGFFNVFSVNVIPVILFLIIFVLQNLRRPLIVSLISDIIPSEKLSTGLSVESQLKTIFIAAFSPILGFLADKIGVGWALFAFSAFMLVLYPLIKISAKYEGEKN
ncbi:MAG: MFS transporter [Thermotogota bacterium]|nr:MFS transporter [Thermotogota bacterium]